MEIYKILKKKIIYFTFDCGYENGYTGKILDILKKHNVKAAFFVTKAFVESNPKLCKRMKKEGFGYACIFLLAKIRSHDIL